MKLEKLLNDSDYLKTLIKTCENRIEEEINKKFKSDYDFKQWIEQKMGIIKEDIV